VSVMPEWQGRGLGSRLVREALARLRHAGGRGCVLVGEPSYYGRFGFRADPRLVLPDVPPQYFQALCLEGPVPPEGLVAFDAAFAATQPPQ
jgi:putative acetyltransferase